MCELCKQAEEGAKQVSIDALLGKSIYDYEEKKFTDYAAGVSGPTRPIDLTDEQLTALDDEEIDEVVSARAEEVANDLRKRRDDAVEREFREEAHAEAMEVFRYHHPQAKATAEKHENVRNACGLLAHRLIDTCPPSSELDTALDRLREVMFWANAAVALG